MQRFGATKPDDITKGLVGLNQHQLLEESSPQSRCPQTPAANRLIFVENKLDSIMPLLDRMLITQGDLE